MSVNLDRFVNAIITRASRTVSRRGFGTISLVGYFDGPAWPLMKRSVEYSTSASMRLEGFAADHPLVLAAERLEVQSPRVRSWKVARRVGAPAQKIRLYPGTPTEGEGFEVTVGGVSFAVRADAAPSIAEIVAAFTLLVNADPDAIITNIASTAGVQLLDDADLNGAIGASAISPPRNLTFTHSGHADWDATTGTVTGLDANGRVQVETFLIPNGAGTGAQSVTLTKIFSQVTSLGIPAQSGAGGSATLGVGKLFGNANLQITASNNATYVELVVDNDGDWWAYSDISSNLDFQDVTAEPATALATDLDAIKAADADFFGLIVVDAQSPAQIEAVSTWAEGNVVLYCAHTADSDVAENVSTDIASTLSELEHFRTAVFYSKRNHGRFPDAALLGAVFPFPVGSADYEFKKLVGILPDDLGDSAVTILTGTPQSPLSGKRCTIYVDAIPTGTNAGTSITTGGLTSGGEWIENVGGFDFWRALLQERAFVGRLNVPKQPYTQDGIDLFLGSCRSATETVAAAPYNILDPASLVFEATPLEETSAEDRAARYYDGVRIGARAQGAMRAFNVSATVVP